MILKAWGDWALFQELLVVLRSIGNRHGGVSIANVATRWVLDQPAVGAVIIGEYEISSRLSLVVYSIPYHQNTPLPTVTFYFSPSITCCTSLTIHPPINAAELT